MIKGLAARLRNAIALTISATQTGQYNVFTAAGSPSAAIDVYLTINTGVVLEAGLIATSLPANSTLTIINNGRIAGIGGAGGNGWGADISSNEVPGGAGSNGGHAIESSCPTTLDNTNGEVFGGGGGGAGGAVTRKPPGGAYTYRGCGGGGGGGRGYNNAAAGIGGASAVSIFENGFTGVAGSSAAFGTAGLGRNDAGPGGDGGDWGTAGTGGQGGAADSSITYTGGTAGQAVKTNGGGLTITGGNNGVQIKGAAA